MIITIYTKYLESASTGIDGRDEVVGWRGK